MSIKEYTRKRSFDKTPEPSPSPAARPAGPALMFCVQRHHATRLHYDLRLEVGAVLKSWAVPKGPTLDPAEKRLAVMVEDHPLEYGGFEGNIPKGNYGAGSVMLWDRGTYELLGEASADEQLERGDFKFRLHGAKLNGEFAIVLMKGRGKGNEWLLLKKKDASAQPGWDTESHHRSVLTGRTQEEIALDLPPHNQPPAGAPDLGHVPGAVASPLPRAIVPMKAVPAQKPPSGDDWLFEVKWDGVRAIAYVEGGTLRLVSRNGNDMTRQYPELSVLPHHLAAESAVLDGEIAALDDRGLPSFARLQRRITVSDPAAVAALARRHPVAFYVFDLVYLDGYDLRDTPLADRKALLQQILKADNLIRYSQHFSGDGQGFFEAVKAQGLEGIVAKRTQSRYQARRSGDWVKVKALSRQEFLICGYTKGERDFFGALVLGLYDKGKLTWAGDVGTGFDRAMMEHIRSLLRPLMAKRPLFDIDRSIAREVTWVDPKLVCEVKFSSWTEENRLRAPSFVGLRPDVDPQDCLREDASAEPASVQPPLAAGTGEKLVVTVDGHRLTFTNLNKVFYPEEEYTKRDIINYYDAVADLIAPHLKDRPLSLKRYPNGIAGEYFFQKEAAGSFPKWLRVEEAEGIHYVIGEDRATLLFLANLGCIDQNPGMSRMGSIEHPDYILIDLDPQHCPYSGIVEAALVVRKKLDRLELEGYPKTTGGDGMHIYVPIEPAYSFEQARSFAEILARLAAAERPDLFTTPRAVSRREKGRVYFDWAQIASGKTISAPYVLRAYPGAPVATPLAWREVTPKLTPRQFHIRNVLDRFARVGDLFEGVLKRPQRLEPALEKLAGMVRGA